MVCGRTLFAPTEHDISHTSEAAVRVSADLTAETQTAFSKRNKSRLVSRTPAAMRGSTRSKMVALAYMTHPGRPITGRPSA